MTQTEASSSSCTPRQPGKPPLQDHRLSTLEAALEHYIGPRLKKGGSIPDHNIIFNGGDIHPAIVAFKLASHYTCSRVICGEPDHDYILCEESNWIVQNGHKNLDPPSDPRRKHLIHFLDERVAIIGLTKIGAYHHPENLEDPKLIPFGGKEEPWRHRCIDTYWHTGNCLGWVYHITKEDLKQIGKDVFCVGETNPVGMRAQGTIRLNTRDVLHPGQLVACVDHTGWGKFQYQLLQEDPRTPPGKKGFLYPVQGFRFIAEALSDPHPLVPVPAIAIIDPKKV